MDDPVHVQVQVVKLHLVGVGLGGVHRNTDSVTFSPLWRQEPEPGPDSEPEHQLTDAEIKHDLFQMI